MRKLVIGAALTGAIMHQVSRALRERTLPRYPTRRLVCRELGDRCDDTKVTKVLWMVPSPEISRGLLHRGQRWSRSCNWLPD